MAGLRGDERAWIQGAQAGSLSDLEALFREHWPRAYRAAYLVVHDAPAAEDIAQESFLAAVRALDRFDRRRPFGPWLHRIVVNRAIDWARARALRAEVGDAPLAAVAEDERSQRRFSPPVVAALAQLPRAPRRDRPPPPARVHARRDRRVARASTGHGELAAAARAGRARRPPGARGPMNEHRLRQALLSVAPPDEIGAQRRAWRVVRTAFGEREPTPWPIRHRRPIGAVAIGVAPPRSRGEPTRARGDRRGPRGGRHREGGRGAAGEACAVLAARRGQSARVRPERRLDRLRGRVESRLGDYDEATWSPRGLFVGVSKRHQLAAVTPKGDVRWTLSRPRVHDASWAPSGFRVAYLSGSNLRVVVGDGPATDGSMPPWPWPLPGGPAPSTCSRMQTETGW